jgi:hypothetical protein
MASASCSGALPGEWLDGAAYCTLAPRSAEKAERNLYRTEIDAILDILKKEARSEDSPRGAGATQWSTAAR